MKRLYILVFLIFFLSGLNAEKINNFMLNDWKYLIGKQNQTFTDIENKNFINLNFNINSKIISNLVPGKEGFIWLKKEFMLPENLYDKNLSIILGKIIIAGETYFNGKLLGTIGKFPPNIFCEWNDYQIYDIPDNLVYKNKKNIIAMKIYVNGEGSISGVIKLDEKNKIKSEYNILQFFDLNIHAISAVLILIFCIYHLLFFIKRKKERYNLYYSLLCLSVLLYQLDYYYSRIINTFNININYFLFLKLFNNQVFLIFFFLCLFLTNFLNHNKSKSEKIFLIIFLILPILITSSIPIYKTFITVRDISNIFIFGNVFYAIFVIIKSLKNKKLYARSISFITSIWFICVAFDVIFHGFFNYLTLPYISVIGFTIFIIGIALIMASKFTNLYKELEFLNINLEKKVEERTVEIKIAYNELSESNKKLQEVQNKLIIYATTDHLTGLYNRFELQKRMNEEMSRIKRYKNSSNKYFSVIFIDLDNFKYYNDTFGHEIGDLILIEFSNILKKITRNVDIIARFGGDEFVIILPETDTNGAKYFVQRIYNELKRCNYFTKLITTHISKKIKINDKNRISCSIGIATTSENIDNNNILQKADEALYKAKKNGKNSFCF